MRVRVTLAPVWREVPSRVAEPARVCWTSAGMRAEVAGSQRETARVKFPGRDEQGARGGLKDGWDGEDGWDEIWGFFGVSRGNGDVAWWGGRCVRAVISR